MDFRNSLGCPQSFKNDFFAPKDRDISSGSGLCFVISMYGWIQAKIFWGRKKFKVSNTFYSDQSTLNNIQIKGKNNISQEPAFLLCNDFFYPLKMEYKAYKNGERQVHFQKCWGGVWGRAPAAGGEEILNLKHISYACLSEQLY